MKQQLKDRKQKVENEIGEIKRQLKEKEDELKEINDELGIVPKKKVTKRKRNDVEEGQITEEILTPKEKRSKVIVEELFVKVKNDIKEITKNWDNINEKDEVEEEINSIEKGAKKYTEAKILEVGEYWHLPRVKLHHLLEIKIKTK